MSKVRIEVTVTVQDDGVRNSAAFALEMVKDALASRPQKWQGSTFVSEGDVTVKEWA